MKLHPVDAPDRTPSRVDAALCERITGLFAEMQVEIPSLDTDLFDSGVIDSLTFAELVVLLKREFGVMTSIGDMEADNFKSIAHIAAFVSTRISSTGDETRQNGRAET